MAPCARRRAHGETVSLTNSGEIEDLHVAHARTADGLARRAPSGPGVRRPARPDPGRQGLEDDRDARVPGVPKLRVAIEKCFGVYADLHWFKLNRTTNQSGQPLLGLFERMAASLARVSEKDLAELLTALLSASPDAAVLRMLSARGGRIRGMGLELFSRIAYAYRRDLFFVLPKPWAESSGCLGFVGDDLRRYCGLCRNLRAVCDRLEIPTDVRGSVLLSLLERKRPPAALLEALHGAIGPALAKFSGLEPLDAFEVKGDVKEDDLPTEFAAAAIRMRRGRRELRDQLLRRYGDKCAFSGGCPQDLLEVAYLVPYPTGDVHAPENAILLRSDLHTLWDLNLLGVDPSTLRVALAPNLSGSPYEKLAGRALTSRADGSHLSREGLAERWQRFSSAHAAPKPERAVAARVREDVSVPREDASLPHDRDRLADAKPALPSRIETDADVTRLPAPVPAPRRAPSDASS
jgi:hypothetical protein